MVTLHEILVVSDSVRARARIVKTNLRVGHSHLWLFPERKQRFGGVGDARGRQDVAGERRAVQRVYQLHRGRNAQQLAEVAIAEFVGRQKGRRSGARQAAAAAFIVEHEEGLVLAVVQLRQHHRTVHHEPELVLANALLTQARRRGVEVVLEIIFRVELVVAQEFKQRTVQVVGARTHHHDQLCAGVKAVLGRIGAREHFHFFNRLRGRREGNRVDPRFGRHHAVERCMLAHFALPVGNDRDGLPGNRDTAAAAALSVQTAAAAEHDARLQNRQVAHVPAVHRQFHNPLLFNHVADRRFVGLQRRRRAGYFHALGNLADLQRNVGAEFFINLKHQAGPVGRLEARGFHCD